MANSNADGEIVLGLQIAQTTQLIQSQLNQLSKNLSLLITGKLDYAKTSSQLKKDLKNLKENINLIGTIDKSKLKKDVQAAVSQVQVAPKIDTGALQKQIEKVSINPNVEGNSELQQMGNNLDSINKKSAATVASVGLLNQAFRTLQNTAKQMIRTAAELDQQLTDLRMVTGQNYEDASRLVDSYNALAKELGATTSQVVDAADEWLRQGKSISEVEQLIAQSMVLSKVGKMDSADATKNLTSAMKGYGLAVDDVSGIVDKLTAIDLQAAVSSSDLAIAMSKTASSANLAGVSMDKLLGYLAVMKETTQGGAEEIGTTMRTIFARLQNVKIGKFVDDETGEAINDVESALGKVGIALRETNGDFRNMEDVLDEVAAKWSALTNFERAGITAAIAGTRQREKFTILMENYGKALEYAEVATNSEGTAMKKFAAYQESVEAHFNTLIASAEALSKQTFPPELLNGFIDAGTAVLDFLEATNLLTIALTTLGAALAMKGLGVFGSKIKSIYQSVTNLSAAFDILGKSANVKLSTEQFNQLLTVTKGLSAQQLKLVVSNKALTTEQRMMILTASGLTKEEAQQTLATMGLTTAEGAATTATFSLSGAFKALGAAIAANPIGFLVMALTTAVTVISTVNNKLAEARQEIIDTGNEAAEHANNLIELANTYFALADAVDAGTAAKEDMLVAQDDIIKALGLEGQSVDELIDKYGDLQTAIKTVTLEQLDTDISQAIKGAKTAKSASEIVAVYKQMQEAIHQQAEEYRKLGLDENSDYIQDLQKQWWEYQDSIKDAIIDAYDNIVGELENSVTLTENLLDNAIADSDYGAIVRYTSDIVDYYRQMQDAIHQQAEYYRSLGYSNTSDEVSKLSDLWWDYYEKIKKTSANAWQQVLDNAHDAIDEITGLYDTLRSAAEEFSEVGQISVSTFQSIAKLGIENLVYLQDENGLLVINEENIQKVIAARTQQMAIETALNYVQQLRQAQENGEIATLANLTLATQVTTQSTWDLVYAQLRLLGLQDEYFDGALQNINNLRSLSDMVAPNFSQLQTQIKETNDVAKKSLEDQEDALNDLLKYVEEMIKQEVENQVKALEDQVDSYKEIVLLQKKSLDLEKEKDKYTQTVADKEKGIADLRKQIAALDLDDSREAAAQKAKLQEELSDKINDLADYQSDHAYDAASDMLDDMADSYEREKKKEIEILENSISSEEKLYQLAIERINNHWDTLYQDLINWNYEYGSVTNDEITSAWNNASAAVQQYGGYLNAVLETQRQIAALEAASANPPSIDTDGKNPPVGKPGDYDTSGGATMDEIKRIVAQMKANSAQHGSEDAAGKLRLNKANLALGEQLAKLIGRVVVRGDDGVWYLDRVGGKRLYSTYPYSTYHTGGVAGDNPTLKQNEIIAKLEKGEVIIPEKQQDNLYEILDTQETMLAKYGALFGAVQSTDLVGSKMQEQIKQDVQQTQSIVKQRDISIENNLTIPVQVLQKLDQSEIKKLTKDISKHTVSEINDVFRKNGMDSVLNPLRPR